MKPQTKRKVYLILNCLLNTALITVTYINVTRSLEKGRTAEAIAASSISLVIVLLGIFVTLRTAKQLKQEVNNSYEQLDRTNADHS
jgi:uncharacterized membrane protein